MPKKPKEEFLEIEPVNGETFVCLVPEKLVIPHSKELEAKLRQLLKEKYKLVYLDCRNLKKCDTTGLSYIISYQKYFKDRGGEIKLINVADEHIKQVFRAILLNKTLSVEEV